MPKERNYKWKLGVFSVIALVVAIAAIYVIGQQKNKFGSVLHVYSMFSSVSGLKVGSNVRLGGIDVGTVNAISLVTDTTVQEKSTEVYQEGRQGQHRLRRPDG